MPRDFSKLINDLLQFMARLRRQLTVAAHPFGFQRLEGDFDQLHPYPDRMGGAGELFMDGNPFFLQDP